MSSPDEFLYELLASWLFVDKTDLRRSFDLTAVFQVNLGQFQCRVLSVFFLHLLRKRTFRDKWHIHLRAEIGGILFLSRNQQCQTLEETQSSDSNQKKMIHCSRPLLIYCWMSYGRGVAPLTPAMSLTPIPSANRDKLGKIFTESTTFRVGQFSTFGQ